MHAKKLRDELACQRDITILVWRPWSDIGSWSTVWDVLDHDAGEPTSQRVVDFLSGEKSAGLWRTVLVTGAKGKRRSR
jgi:hypothetical protein